MRKSREEAAETHKRIVQAAARQFREKGIAATGLAELMKAAGLTHGGFYKHFASKDQLVAEATAAAVDSLLKEMAAHPTFKSALAAYLSTRHRDNPASGCPLAALGDELARSGKEARGGNGGLHESGGHAGGGRLQRGGSAASSCRGGDHDRRGNNVALGDRPRAVSRDPLRGGETPGGRSALTVRQTAFRSSSVQSTSATCGRKRG